MWLIFHRCFFLFCFVFSSEKKLFSWTYLLKKTPRRTKILISLFWNKILKIWDRLLELIHVEVQCCKNYFNFFLPQEAGAFGNNTERELQKPRPKLKIFILYIYREYLLCLQSIPSGRFLQKCINFLQKCLNFKEQRLKFSHSTGLYKLRARLRTCTQRASRVHEYSCTTLSPLCKNNLNLPFSHADRYALRK